MKHLLDLNLKAQKWKEDGRSREGEGEFLEKRQSEMCRVRGKNNLGKEDADGIFVCTNIKRKIVRFRVSVMSN